MRGPYTYIICGIYNDEILSFACMGYDLKQAMLEYLNHNQEPKEKLAKIYETEDYTQYQLNIIHFAAGLQDINICKLDPNKIYQRGEDIPYEEKWGTIADIARNCDLEECDLVGGYGNE